MITLEKNYELVKAEDFKIFTNGCPSNNSYILLKNNKATKLSIQKTIELLYDNKFYNKILDLFDFDNIEEIETFVEYHKQGREEVRAYYNEFGFIDTQCLFKFNSEQELEMFLS